MRRESRPGFFEVNFDGIVGPTHNYAGLSYGNVASQSNRSSVSRPKEAVLQGLAKMKALADLGLVQGVLPPQERPDLAALHRLGFSGNDARVLESAAQQAPALLAACSSASSMWSANAATVSPAPDCEDGRTHFTAANLSHNFHRSLEASATSRMLRAIFSSRAHFTHHDPLPSGNPLGDEGAANHTRLCRNYGEPGLELFVYGREALRGDGSKPELYPARQTLEASQAVARLHGLSEESAVFIQQNPEAIDAGVFHNDVASVGNENVYFCHEKALLNQSQALQSLSGRFEKKCKGRLEIIEVPAAQVSLKDAVSSYLFNSQLVTLPSGEGKKHMALIAPSECEENAAVKNYLSALTKSGCSIREVRYFDLRQSMRNGGGPACLRLRVVMSQKQISSIKARVFLDDALYKTLVAWAKRHYRDELTPADLADPKLIKESRAALAALMRILRLRTLDA